MKNERCLKGRRTENRKEKTIIETDNLLQKEMEEEKNVDNGKRALGREREG